MTTEQLRLDMPLRALARGSDPQTSHDAAALVDVTDLEGRVLDWLGRAGDFGGTSEEIANGLGVPRVSISPRLRPLLNKGRVLDSGLRRLSTSRRACIVWWRVPEAAAVHDPRGDESFAAEGDEP